MEKLKKQQGKYIEKSREVYALTYCRVSSVRQATDGHGLDAQEQRCSEFIKSKGFIPDRVFRDTISGGNDHLARLGMKELFDYADANPQKSFVFVIDDISRLARDVKVHFEIRVELRNRGIDVASPNFQFENTPEGEMIETMLAAQSQYHRKNNRRQVVQKMKARMELGYWPFAAKRGYVMIKDPAHGKLSVPSKDGVMVLKPAMEGFANGRLVRKIDVCQELVSKGFWKKQSSEKYIDKLTSILKDPFYAGDIEYLGNASARKYRKKKKDRAKSKHDAVIWDVTRRPGKHKGIISLETFELIQKRLRKEEHNKRIRLDISPEFPLRGLLLCADCGEHLTAGKSAGRSNTYAYYVCHNKACEQYGKSARKKDVEDRFKELLLRSTLKAKVDVVVSSIFDEEWKKETDLLQEEKNALAKKEKALNEQVKQLTEMAIATKSEVVRKAYEVQMEELINSMKDSGDSSVEKFDPEIPYRTAFEKATGMLKSPYSVWVDFDVVEQQKLFYFIFEEKLRYCIKEGYRTENSPNAVRLFEEFVGANAQIVEMGGIEPPCKKEFSLNLQT